MEPEIDFDAMAAFGEENRLPGEGGEGGSLGALFFEFPKDSQATSGSQYVAPEWEAELLNSMRPFDVQMVSTPAESYHLFNSCRVLFQAAPMHGRRVIQCNSDCSFVANVQGRHLESVKGYFPGVEFTEKDGIISTGVDWSLFKDICMYVETEGRCVGSFSTSIQGRVMNSSSLFSSNGAALMVIAVRNDDDQLMRCIIRNSKFSTQIQFLNFYINMYNVGVIIQRYTLQGMFAKIRNLMQYEIEGFFDEGNRQCFSMRNFDPTVFLCEVNALHVANQAPLQGVTGDVIMRIVSGKAFSDAAAATSCLKIFAAWHLDNFATCNHLMPESMIWLGYSFSRSILSNTSTLHAPTYMHSMGSTHIPVPLPRQALPTLQYNIATATVTTDHSGGANSSSQKVVSALNVNNMNMVVPKGKGDIIFRNGRGRQAGYVSLVNEQERPNSKLMFFNEDDHVKNAFKIKIASTRDVVIQVDGGKYLILESGKFWVDVKNALIGIPYIQNCMSKTAIESLCLCTLNTKDSTYSLAEIKVKGDTVESRAWSHGGIHMVDNVRWISCYYKIIYGIRDAESADGQKIFVYMYTANSSWGEFKVDALNERCCIMAHVASYDSVITVNHEANCILVYKASSCCNPSQDELPFRWIPTFSLKDVVCIDFNPMLLLLVVACKDCVYLINVDFKLEPQRYLYFTVTECIVMTEYGGVIDMMVEKNDLFDTSLYILTRKGISCYKFGPGSKEGGGSKSVERVSQPPLLKPQTPSPSHGVDSVGKRKLGNEDSHDDLHDSCRKIRKCETELLEPCKKISSIERAKENNNKGSNGEEPLSKGVKNILTKDNGVAKKSHVREDEEKNHSDKRGDGVENEEKSKNMSRMSRMLASLKAKKA